MKRKAAGAETVAGRGEAAGGDDGRPQEPRIEPEPEMQRGEVSDDDGEDEKAEEGEESKTAPIPPILFAVTEHPDIWKRVIGVAASVVDEGDLEFSGEGMMIRSFFATKGAFLQLHLRPQMFQVYALQEPQLCLGQSFKKLAKVMQRVGQSVKYLGGNRVRYEVGASSQHKGCKRCRYLKVLTSGERTASDFDRYDHCVRLKSLVFFRMMQDLLCNGGKEVRVSVSARRTRWVTEDVDGEETCQWPHHDASNVMNGDGGPDVQVVKAATQDFQVLFKLEPFAVAAKAYRVSEWVQVFFSRDFPSTAKVEYILPDDLGILFFIIAARNE